jgi:hypothetical protein
MGSILKRSKSVPPVALSWRARLLLRYVRWVGPVAAGRTGIAVIRHRRALRSTTRVAAVAGAMLIAGGVAGVIKRRVDRAAISSAA